MDNPMSKALEMQKNNLKTLILESPDLFEKPWKAAALPVNAITGIPYGNFRNTLTLVLEVDRKGYSSNKWITYAQAKKNKFFIRKDEVANGTWITGWFKKKTNDDEDDSSKKGFSFYPKAFKVYNLDQLEEAPSSLIPDIETNIGEESGVSMLLDVLALYEAMKVDLKFADGDSCYYSVSRDQVTCVPVERFTSPSKASLVLLHELNHATGNEKRLDRDMSGSFGSPSYAREEVIAETAALATALNLGIDYEPGHSAGYIRSWLTACPDMLDDCIEEATKACSYVMKHRTRTKIDNDVNLAA